VEATPFEASGGRSLRDFRWAVSSPASDRINDILMILSGLCALVCLVVALVLDVVHFTGHPSALPLVAIGMPVLLAGQVWTIAVLNARKYPNGPPRGRHVFNGGVRLWTIFGGIPKWIPLATLAMVAVSTFSFLHPLQGVRTSSKAPEAAGAFLLFYAMHWGVESSEHFRRKRSRKASLDGPEGPTNQS